MLGQADYSPPFLAPNTTGGAILNGVNYASGGAGILNATGKIFVSIVVRSFSLSSPHHLRFVVRNASRSCCY